MSTALYVPHFALMDMLVNLRRQRHTVREVAQSMGITETRVRDIESEDSDPTLSQLQSYARAVGVHVRFLVESPTWRRDES
jgi:transcriptional regulator with XRE-family HTH domain